MGVGTRVHYSKRGIITLLLHYMTKPNVCFRKSLAIIVSPWHGITQKARLYTKKVQLTYGIFHIS